MHQHRKNRQGSTAVELSLVLPILFALLFAAIDFARVENVRHSCGIAAYEGARTGILPGRTADDVRAVVQENLDKVGILDSTITVTPDVLDTDSAQVTIDIVTPLARNMYAYSTLFSSRSINTSFTLTRESAYAELTQ